MDVVDSKGKILSWEDYGITIIFPPGAIPEGKEILVRVLEGHSFSPVGIAW